MHAAHGSTSSASAPRSFTSQAEQARTATPWRPSLRQRSHRSLGDARRKSSIETALLGCRFVVVRFDNQSTRGLPGAALRLVFYGENGALVRESFGAWLGSDGVPLQEKGVDVAAGHDREAVIALDYLGFPTIDASSAPLYLLDYNTATLAWSLERRGRWRPPAIPWRQSVGQGDAGERRFSQGILA